MSPEVAAHLGPREMSALSPQSGPKRTLVHYAGIHCRLGDMPNQLRWRAQTLQNALALAYASVCDLKSNPTTPVPRASRVEEFFPPGGVRKKCNTPIRGRCGPRKITPGTCGRGVPRLKGGVGVPRVGSYQQLSHSARHECFGTQLGKVCPIRVGKVANPGTGGWIGFPF